MLVGSWRWCALFINRCPKASRLRGAPGWYVGQPLLRAACSEPSLAESHTSPQPLLATLLVSGHPSLKKAFWVKTVCQPVPVTLHLSPGQLWKYSSPHLTIRSSQTTKTPSRPPRPRAEGAQLPGPCVTAPAVVVAHYSWVFIML